VDDVSVVRLRRLTVRSHTRLQTARRRARYDASTFFLTPFAASLPEDRAPIMHVHPLRIYLVEDSMIMFGLLRDLIEKTGAEVVGHSVGAAEAIDEIGRESPDVVIVDIALTDGNGFDVLKAMRAADSKPIVYFLSNHAASPYRERASLLGADGFFSKDAEMTALVDSVAALVNERSS
jgi:CheY-like chemotaxis protein